MFKTLFAWLGKVMSEDNGNPSMTRFNTTYVVIACATVLCIGFLYVVACYKDLIMPYVITLSSLVTGLMINKTVSKSNETKVPADCSKPDEVK